MLASSDATQIVLESASSNSSSDSWADSWAAQKGGPFVLGVFAASFGRSE